MKKKHIVINETTYEILKRFGVCLGLSVNGMIDFLIKDKAKTNKTLNDIKNEVAGE